jgi:transposase
VGQVSTIGLDTAKQVFQAHVADEAGNVVFRKKLPRGRVLAFLADQPPCLVALEACGGSHHWAREIGKLGHQVKLIAPKYVKPFVKRQKNDMADAEASCEAAQRPTMRFVPVKTEAAQASALVFRTRDLLVRQRTQIINALRGHLTEYGWVAAKGTAHVAKLVERVEDPACPLPEEARPILQVLITSLKDLDEKIALLDVEIAKRAKEDPLARRLNGDGDRRLGAAGGKLRQGARLRRLGGADAAAEIHRRKTKARRHLEDGRADHPPIAHYRGQRRRAPGGALEGSWLERMLARKPRMLVTVALANKTAPIVWALLTKGEVYKAAVAAVA